MSEILTGRDLPAGVGSGGPLLPDVERILSRYLRGRDDVAALAPDRVYTSFPSDAGNEPLIVITRIGGAPEFTRPLVFERANVQLDVYGGPKRAAQVLARTAQLALSELDGVLDDEVNAGSVSCELGALRYVPDESFTPARPRYVLDAVVNAKAAGQVPVGASP